MNKIKNKMLYYIFQTIKMSIRFKFQNFMKIIILKKKSFLIFAFFVKMITKKNLKNLLISFLYPKKSQL